MGRRNKSVAATPPESPFGSWPRALHAKLVLDRVCFYKPVPRKTMGRKPKSVMVTLAVIDDVRRDDCANSSRCNWHAVRAGFDAWGCRDGDVACPHFEKDPEFDAATRYVRTEGTVRVHGRKK